MHLDQKAQIRWESDLIACVRNKSDGPGALGAREAAELIGTEPRGGELTGVDGSGIIGVYLGCGLAVEHKSGMGNRPG